METICLVFRQKMTNVIILISQKKLNTNVVVDDGYYEDMYPKPEEKPNTFRPVTAVSIVINDEQEIDDDVAIREAEQWAANHPLSAQSQGHSNQGFQDVGGIIINGVLHTN